VKLNLQPLANDVAFDGDFYAFLTHNGKMAVLLNRVGVTGSNPYGYADSGLNVTFSDKAVNGNIHYYQSVVNPNGGVLTGTWQPDGRNVSPISSGSAIAATLPTADLSSFVGQAADTSWTLFIADTSQYGEGKLVGWNLEITGNGVSVPDATNTLVLLMLLLALLFLIKHSGQKQPVLEEANQDL